MADVITLKDEIIYGDSYEIFDPVYTWKKKNLKNVIARKLQVPVFIDGTCVYESPKIEKIREYCTQEVESMWEEVIRFVNPQKYYVDLSFKLWNLKNEMLEKHRL